MSKSKKVVNLSLVTKIFAYVYASYLASFGLLELLKVYSVPRNILITLLLSLGMLPLGVIDTFNKSRSHIVIFSTFVSLILLLAFLFFLLAIVSITQIEL